MNTPQPSPSVSYEIFPGKDAAAAEKVSALVKDLSARSPAAVSVTYGAGGSTTEPSLAAVRDAVENAGCPVAAHITCVGQSKDAALGAARQMLAAEASKFVALRGDPPGGVDAPYFAHPDGFDSTPAFIEALVSLASSLGKTAGIIVSGYPEVHPQSRSLEHDLDLLAAKIDAGATSLTTQFCFDVDAVLRYRDAIAARGLSIPIQVGLMVPFPAPRVLSMASKCAASAPESLLKALEAPDQLEAATGFTAALADRLFVEGLDRFHVYTMNNLDVTTRVFEALQAPHLAPSSI